MNLLIILQANLPIQTVPKSVPVPEMSLFELLIKGGWVLVPLLIISVISIYLIVVKYFEIKMFTKTEDHMVTNFKNSLSQGNVVQALSHLKMGQSSYSKIFYHATLAIGRPIREIEDTIESAAQIELSKMNRNIHYLGLFAGIAPMLGFVGTIAGVIKIFYNISLADNISIGVISGGLYEKMIASGTGLIVGVVAYTGYHMLNIMIDKYMSMIEQEAFEFTGIIQNNKG
jgi:biopolymer transport protein ExbB